MEHSDIEHMAQGYPPSHIGKDHEEVVIELAERVLSLQQRLDAATRLADSCKNAEMVWEKTMMESIGEDGPACVSKAIAALKSERDAVVADQKRYEFLAQFFDVDMWDADDYHCIRGLCFNEPKFDRVTVGLPYDMSLDDAIDEHLKRAGAAKGGSDD